MELGFVPACDVAAFDQDAALRRNVEACHKLDEGRLPGAVGSYQGDMLARFDAQVEVP